MFGYFHYMKVEIEVNIIIKLMVNENEKLENEDDAA